jgi:hypothetical protein
MEFGASGLMTGLSTVGDYETDPLASPHHSYTDDIRPV